MFPVQGKSVVITIWQTLVHVLSNTALKLFRFIRVKNSHYFGGPCDKNMANNTNARQPMLSRVADVVSGMKSEKCPIFQDYSKLSIQLFGKTIQVVQKPTLP